MRSNLVRCSSSPRPLHVTWWQWLCIFVGTSVVYIFLNTTGRWLRVALWAWMSSCRTWQCYRARDEDADTRAFRLLHFFLQVARAFMFIYLHHWFLTQPDALKNVTMSSTDDPPLAIMTRSIFWRKAMERDTRTDPIPSIPQMSNTTAS